MKLMEIMGLPMGTYVAFRLSVESSSAIRKWALQNGIKKYATQKEDRAHVTVIYSRKVITDYTPSTKELTASFGGFDLFDGKDDKPCLVMRIVCPELIKIHTILKNVYGGLHDYDVYSPHITITYDASNINISNLTPFYDKITLCDEYLEPLKL